MESRSCFFRGSTVKLCLASTVPKTAPKTCHRPTGQVLVASEEMAQEAGAFWGGFWALVVLLYPQKWDKLLLRWSSTNPTICHNAWLSLLIFIWIKCKSFKNWGTRYGHLLFNCYLLFLGKHQFIYDILWPDVQSILVLGSTTVCR